MHYSCDEVKYQIAKVLITCEDLKDMGIIEGGPTVLDRDALDRIVEDGERKGYTLPSERVEEIMHMLCAAPPDGDKEV